VFQSLAAYGADLRFNDKFICNALHFAADRGFAMICKYLAQRGMKLICVVRRYQVRLTAPGLTD